MPKESETEYHHKLKSLLDSSKQWHNEISGFPLQEAVRNFIEEIGILYLNYFQTHLEESKICAIDYQQSLPLLVKLINTEYVYEMRHQLVTANAYDDTWETACSVRTNCEAFQDMFGVHLDFAGIVEYMQDRKGNVRADRDTIPINTPLAHWWWFADFEYKD